MFTVVGVVYNIASSKYTYEYAEDTVVHLWIQLSMLCKLSINNNVAAGVAMSKYLYRYLRLIWVI